MDSGVRSESLPPPGSEQSTVRPAAPPCPPLTPPQASLSPSLPPLPPRGAPVKPREQLSLSEEELAEELTRSLTAANPHAAANVVRYHQRERVFRLDPMVEHTAVHWSRDGCRVHVRSEAAAEQAARAATRAAREAEEAARLREALGEAEPEPEAEGAAEGEGGASAAPEKADAAAGAEGQSDADGGDASAAASAAAAAAANGTPPSTPPGEGAPAAPPPAAAAAAPQARFRNQFVYKERGMQTVNNARRDKCCATEPAPKMTFCGDCGRRAIYDWYLQDQRQQERQRALRDALARRSKEAESRGAAGGGAASAPAAAEAAEAGEDGESTAAGGGGGAGGAESFMSGAAFERSTKLLERMVCQNAFREMADDFKYWDDASDAARAGGEGSLLPLWSFACEAAKRRAVTALAWHPAYDDLFAVGYGSFDFLRPVAGLVALFSLKCPSQPEALLPLPDGGVTSLAFHPQHGALLAVGTHDGSVAVFDVRGACGGGGAARAGAVPRAPLFASNARRGKHDEPVWQLAWAADEGPGEAGSAQRLAFYSVSGDGRVCLWSMSKSDLSVATIMELRAAPPPALAAAPPLAGPPTGPTEEAMCEEALLASRVGGTCFDFVAPGGGGGGGGGNGVYIVGTEEGGIHRCSTAYASRYLGSYAGHSMAVYSLRWSPFGGSVFLSASADWSVRLWDARPGGARAPVLSFDLGAAVGDAAWAPHCATAFAAAGADGRVHFYDLAVNKAEALCAQKVVKKARLTKLAFNGAHPVLLAGDDKGTVLCLKLSPNLRKTGAPAAAHAGGGGAAAAEGEGEGAGGEEAAQRARQHAIVDTALRGAVGAASEVPQQRSSDGSRGAIGMGGREQS